MKPPTHPTPAPPDAPAGRFSIAKSLLKFVLPAVVIGYLLYRVQPHEWAEIRGQQKDYPVLAAALAVSLAAMVLSFIRWWLLVRCQGIALSVVEAMRLGAIGFLLSFVSAGSVGGDVFKAVFLARRRPGKRVQAVASVLVDRGVGLYGLLLLVSAALWVNHPADVDAVGGDGMRQIKLGTLVFVGLGTAVLTTLVLGGRLIDRLVAIATRWPLVGPVVAAIGPPLRMFHAHPLAFGLSILMSIGVQAMLVVSLYLVASGLYESTPTLSEHFVIVPIGMLASALPIAPAGLGVLEATIEWLYRVVPATPTIAKGTLVALVFEMVKVVMAAIGIVFYWTAGEEVKASLEAPAPEPLAAPAA